MGRLPKFLSRKPAIVRAVHRGGNRFQYHYVDDWTANKLSVALDRNCRGKAGDRRFGIGRNYCGGARKRRVTGSAPERAHTFNVSSSSCAIQNFQSTTVGGLKEVVCCLILLFWQRYSCCIAQYLQNFDDR